MKILSEKNLIVYISGAELPPRNNPKVSKGKLTLNAADHNALNEVLLHERINDEDRNGGDNNGTGLNGLGVGVGLSHNVNAGLCHCLCGIHQHVAENGLQGPLACIIDIQNGGEVVVPVTDSHEQRDGCDGCLGQRQNDGEEDSDIICAVDSGGFFDTLGNGEEEALHDDAVVCTDETREDQSPAGIQQADLLDGQEAGDHTCGEDHGDEHHGHAHGGDAVVGVVGEEADERPQRREADAAVAHGAVGIDDEEDDDGPPDGVFVIRRVG